MPIQPRAKANPYESKGKGKIQANLHAQGKCMHPFIVQQLDISCSLLVLAGGQLELQVDWLVLLLLFSSLRAIL